MTYRLDNVHGLMDYSECRMRAEIEQIPDGRYRFEDVMAVEVFEFRFPWHVEQFKLVDGSGGAGTFRGGLALSKTVRCTHTPMTFSYMSDRQKVAPWGIHGGHEGGKAELFLQRAGSEEWLTISQAFNKVSPSKFANVPIAPGDRIKIASPAGGGWGPPKARDPKRVKEDLLDGFITPEQAQSVYGLAK